MTPDGGWDDSLAFGCNGTAHFSPPNYTIVPIVIRFRSAVKRID
jgi:hypothetical protein